MSCDMICPFFRSNIALTGLEFTRLYYTQGFTLGYRIPDFQSEEDFLWGVAANPYRLLYSRFGL